MKKLGGWARVGIVVSVLWSIFIFGYAFIEKVELDSARKTNIKFYKDKVDFTKPIELKKLKPLSHSRYFHDRKTMNLSATNINDLFPNSDLIIPLLMIAWIIPIILYWVAFFALKWIVLGFRKRDDKNS